MLWSLPHFLGLLLTLFVGKEWSLVLKSSRSSGRDGWAGRFSQSVRERPDKLPIEGTFWLVLLLKYKGDKKLLFSEHLLCAGLLHISCTSWISRPSESASPVCRCGNWVSEASSGRLPWWSSGKDSELLMQGARVWSLVRELDPTCRPLRVRLVQQR